MARPIPAKAICARNSAVTSTTVEAVAVCHSTPCRVIARAPNTKPAHLGERQAVGGGVAHHAAPDRTQGRRLACSGMITSQAKPRIDEQHELPSDDQAELRPADTADRRDDVAQPEPRHQGNGDQHAHKGKDEGQAFHGRASDGPCGGEASAAARPLAARVPAHRLEMRSGSTPR